MKTVIKKIVQDFRNAQLRGQKLEDNKDNIIKEIARNHAYMAEVKQAILVLDPDFDFEDNQKEDCRSLNDFRARFCSEYADVLVRAIQGKQPNKIPPEIIEKSKSLDLSSEDGLDELRRICMEYVANKIHRG